MFRIRSLVDDQFNFTGRDGRVDRLRRTQRDHALGGDHVFGGKLIDLFVQASIIGAVKHQLRHAVAIPQMNEDHSAQIAASMHPAHQDGPLARIGGSQLPARMSAAKLA